MKLTKLATALGMALCFGAATGSANAAVQYYFPETTFEDDNNDWFIDQGSGYDEEGNLITDLNGLIDAGDRLVSVFELFTTAAPLGSGSSSIAPQELTGIIDGIITSKTLLSALTGQYLFTFAANPTSTYIDGASGEIARAWLASGADVDLDLVGQTCTSLADCTTRASNGSLYLSVGQLEVDDFFALDGTDNPNTVAVGSASSSFTNANYAFSFIVNNTGMLFDKIDCSTNPLAVAGFCNPAATGGDGFTDMVGGGSILGGLGLTNGAFARSDFDFNVRPIPEPSALALLGIGLLGFGLARRNKRA